MDNKVDMKDKKECNKYLRPIEENEMNQWKPAPKSLTTKLFEAFLESEHKMVEVKLDELQFRKHKKTSQVKSTKQDIFASSFYAWKRR